MKEFQGEEAKEFKDALTEFWETYVKKMNQQQMEEFILHFRVQKPKSASQRVVDDFGSYTKLVFKFKPKTPGCQVPEALEEQLVAHLRRLGWHVMLGPPPRTGRERKLIDALKQSAVRKMWSANVIMKGMSKSYASMNL